MELGLHSESALGISVLEAKAKYDIFTGSCRSKSESNA